MAVNSSTSSKKSMSRVMVETFVRQKLNDLKKDPKRTTRNLIDMAHQFSTGRFVKHILELGQELLQDEKSGYYNWIRDISLNADADRLIGFGMNVCYNGLTVGAKTIREIESTEGYNIPWFAAVKVSNKSFSEEMEKYHGLIEEGKNLGIYTWYLFSDDEPCKLLSLIKKEADCAFILFTKPESISYDFLDEAEELCNLMISTEFSDKAAEVCRNMRERRLLYSVHYSYNPQKTESIVKEDIMYRMEELNPALAVFVPEYLPESAEANSLKKYISLSKLENMRKAPGVELWTDSKAIDRVVSDDDCAIAFDEDGSVCSDISQKCGIRMNFKESSLESILQTYFKK